MTLTPRDIAESTPCPYPACEGFGHEPALPQSEWSHRVETTTFDNGCVQLEIHVRPHGVIANLLIDAEGDMSAEELREMATVYAKLPAILEATANRVDALNRELRNTTD